MLVYVEQTRRYAGGRVRVPRHCYILSSWVDTDICVDTIQPCVSDEGVGSTPTAQLDFKNDEL